LARPTKLYHGLNAWAADPLANLSNRLPGVVRSLPFIAYVILYALTHLQPALDNCEPAGIKPSKHENTSKEISGWGNCPGNRR
jgi:hypothetical protein